MGGCASSGIRPSRHLRGVCRTRSGCHPDPRRAPRDGARSGTVRPEQERKEAITDHIRELTARDFAPALPRSRRERLIRGEIRGGKDIAAFRHFVGLSQARFAEALGISVHTLRNWEQDRRRPDGPALALIRVAARHPRVLRENLAVAR